MKRWIFCEGYNDRSFLKGLLESQGAKSKDKKIVEAKLGTFGFTTRSGCELLVTPIGGGLGAVSKYLKTLAKDPQWQPDRILLVRDLDLADLNPAAASWTCPNAARGPNHDVRATFQNWPSAVRQLP